MSGCSPCSRRRMCGPSATHLSSVELADGQILFHEGEPGNELYILAEAEVAISISLPDGTEHQIARFAPGDFFGEMSIFDDAPRSATCQRPRREHPVQPLQGRVHRRHQRASPHRPEAHVPHAQHHHAAPAGHERVRVRNGAVGRGRAQARHHRRAHRRLQPALPRGFAGNLRGGGGGEGTAPLPRHGRTSTTSARSTSSTGTRRATRPSRSAAGIFRSLLGESEVIARYGGDEFVIILPTTGRGGSDMP